MAAARPWPSGTGTGRLPRRSTTTRSRTLHEPTHHTPALRDTLCAIHTRLGLQRARIRALTSRAGHLTPATHAHTQLTLDPTIEDQRRLEPVLDKANNRWGTGTLRPAALTTARANAKTRPAACRSASGAGRPSVPGVSARG
ncbi:hypothetical protein PUR71_07440 [Streptomyces sp. SP17BM10]|uniref:DinB/UmuC family translesion DNA polymerase n=1 Tax=Streptomyces sp. SP17BM10 TaxID=3002530 RepID=UPI002E7776B8|nr:hypothetical protein [Streptomyces sp. SP17BM10]MEE1782751.1 hypothetical protein [Streptomyces sp. SP17BM10]